MYNLRSINCIKRHYMSFINSISNRYSYFTQTKIAYLPDANTFSPARFSQQFASFNPLEADFITQILARIGGIRVAIYELGRSAYFLSQMVIGSSKDLSQAEKGAQQDPSNAQEAFSSFILSIALACFTPFNVMLYVFEMLARTVSTMWNGLRGSDEVFDEDKDEDEDIYNDLFYDVESDYGDEKEPENKDVTLVNELTF